MNTAADAYEQAVRRAALWTLAGELADVAGLAVGLALTVAMFCGCAALRLYRAAGPTDCRTAQGVHIACPETWP